MIIRQQRNNIQWKLQEDTVLNDIFNTVCINEGNGQEYFLENI